MTNAIGRYELRGELGRGGMAAVYRAYDAMLNREVALKVMAGHLATDASFQRRFEREARVIATLEHPSIVPVYDYGITAQGQPYLVMRLLRGGTLYDRLVEGKVTQQQLWVILRQVAAALDYAHDRDIVHRDIKPVNILFDEKGNAYVSDFGIAKVRDATTNLTGNAIVGTAAYMSPEQFMGATVNGRSDQYSLAVVIFEALSGRAPFQSDTLHGLMFQHINEPPPDIHSLNRALPPAVSAVLRRALAKNPDERFATATDFIQMLEAAAGGRLQATEAPHQRQLQQDYDTGLKAYQHSDWATAVDFLGRVVALDTGYRNAAQLHQTARFRLQEQRQTAPATEVAGGATSRLPTQVVPGAGGAAQPAPGQRSRLPLLLGLLALLVVGGLAAFFLLRPTTEPAAPDDGATAIAVAPTLAATTTAEPPTPTPLPTVPPPVVGAALVVEVGSASVSTDGGGAQPLANGAELPLQAGTQVQLAVDEGRTQLVMPSGARLYLDAGSEVSLSADDAGAPLVTVERGRVLAWSHAAPVAVVSAFDGRATLLGAGLMGATLNPGAVRFEVACLEGSCDVSGVNDGEALRLRNGQVSAIGADGFADRPVAADRAPFDALLAEESDVAVAEVAPTAEPTAEPTEEPTAEPTNEPTAAPTNPPPTATRGSATSGSGSNTTALGPGALDFEAFGTWQRGDQENGTLTQSTAQAHSGSRSAALEYDFATAGNDYVVFTQEHAVSGEPNVLRLWVHGDGSGHYLNAWIVDAGGQTWQAPFGRVTHRGWQQMEGRVEVGQKWPWTHISGPDNGQVDYPIRFRAFVLDDYPDTFTGTGTIYLDDLTVATGQAGSAPPATAAPGVTAAPGATATTAPGATAAPTGGAGAILFTAGDSLLTVNPGEQPRILGTATRNTCSTPAEAGGVSYKLVVPGPGCAAVGDGQANCASPNGQYQVIMGRPDGGTRNVSLISPANPNGDFIFNRAVDPAEGILWATNSSSFLIVIGDEVVQIFTDLSFRTVISGVPAFCPRWSAGP